MLTDSKTEVKYNKKIIVCNWNKKYTFEYNYKVTAEVIIHSIWAYTSSEEDRTTIQCSDSHITVGLILCTLYYAALPRGRIKCCTPPVRLSRASSFLET